MGQTVNVNFKLDSDVKKRMELACAEMGLSMSAAFTIFAKKVGREYRIPFEVSADPFTLKVIFVIWKMSCRTLRGARPILLSMT